MSELIGAIFGGLWASIAVMACPPAWRAASALLAIAATAILLVRLWRSEPTRRRGGRLFASKVYWFAVLLEIVVIYAASVALARFGLQRYGIQAVGMIVGLHFIGLWYASGSAQFLWIASFMCAVSAVCVLLPDTLNQFQLRDAATGVGNAVVLWVGAGQSVSRSS